jgi:2-methylcitrate dehydratase PrpD
MDQMMDMMEKHGFNADDVEHIEIILPPYGFKLVGHPFKIGENPRVDAQFNVAYCVVNALLRSPVTLSNFEAKQINDKMMISFIKDRVTVIMDPAVDRTHYASDIHVWTKDGKEYHGQIDVPPGTPANPMTDEEHVNRFYDCVEFSGIKWLKGREEAILNYIENLEIKDDIRGIIPLFCPENGRPKRKRGAN